MDAINLQGLWTNYPGAGGGPAPQTVVAHGRAGARPDWNAILAAWRKKQREEEEERERKDRKYREFVERMRREREKARAVQLEGESLCMLLAVMGDDDE